MNLSGLALGPEKFQKQTYLYLRSVQKLPEIKFKKIINLLVHRT